MQVAAEIKILNSNGVQAIPVLEKRASKRDAELLHLTYLVQTVFMALSPVGYKNFHPHIRVRADISVY